MVLPSGASTSSPSPTVSFLVSTPPSTSSSTSLRARSFARLCLQWYLARNRSQYLELCQKQVLGEHFLKHLIVAMADLFEKMWIILELETQGWTLILSWETAKLEKISKWQSSEKAKFMNNMQNHKKNQTFYENINFRNSSIFHHWPVWHEPPYWVIFSFKSSTLILWQEFYWVKTNEQECDLYSKQFAF